MKWFEVLPDPERSTACVLRVAGDAIGMDQTAEECVAALEPFSEVTLAVDSSGGDSHTAFTLAASLRGRCPLAVISGRCFSAAVLVALAADRRVASKSSKFMVHRVSSAAYGDDRELSAIVTRLIGLNEMAADYIVERTGQPASTVVRWLEGDTYFDAEAAKAAGLIHEILDDPAPVAMTAVAGGAQVETEEARTLLAILNTLGNVPCRNPDRVRRELAVWASRSLSRA